MRIAHCTYSPALMGIVFFILFLHALALLAYWIIADVHIVRSLRGLPTARAGLGLGATDDQVCVVVPAHNEERVIAGLVASLRAQDHPRVRFVLALDRCTDRTREIAEREIAGDPRFEIIEIRACPEDWAGKVHAVWRGVGSSEAARSADLLLFTDADTEFHPGLVRASAALLRSRGLDMLSLWSDLASEHWFEGLVQPACGMELMYQYPLHNANRAQRRRAFANGQFILFTREGYEAIGGHESVNQAVLEDMALARRMVDAGRPTGVFLADGMLRVRMYATWSAFQVGWRRIFIDCAKFKVSRLRKHAWRVRVTMILLPLGSIAAGASALSGAVEADWLRVAMLSASIPALALWLGNLLLIYRLGGFPLRWVPLQPIGAWLVSRILLRAADDLERGEPVRWGGKSYSLKAR